MYRSIFLVTFLWPMLACSGNPPVKQPETVVPPPPATGETATDEERVIEVVAVPKAATSAALPEPHPEDGRVCRMERRTGTNRAVRVCRSYAEIEQESIESKETFDELRRSQQEYKH